VSIGATVSFQVDAYPGRSFIGKVRYLSPTLEATQRSLTVEAVVDNPGNELKPGLFATALIEQPDRTPGVVVPAAAVLTAGGTSRVFVVAGDHVEERIVTVGTTAEAGVEVTNGLKAGERVATENVSQLFDGAKVS
jgi:Cu(I)/Ag(I) efflux system membrane fusion protein